MLRGGIPVLFNLHCAPKLRAQRMGNAVAQAISQDDIQKGVNPDAKREASEQPAVAEGDKLIDTHGAYLDSPRNVAERTGCCICGYE